MSDRICKCCGQSLPQVEGLDFPLPKGLAELVNLVRRAGKWGISTDRLFDSLYSHRPDGGPQTKTLHVRVNQVNKVLRQHGWVIRGEHSGQRYVYGRYVLVKLEEVRNAANG